MAERAVSLEFVFDRAGAQALAGAYRSLVPERRARSAAGRSRDDDSQAATTGSGGDNQLQLMARSSDDDRRALGA